jgi:hypothetical protein
MGRPIPDRAKLRVVIDGVSIQTTAELIRRGAVSASLHQAWCDFEDEHMARGIVGRMTGYSDIHLGRQVNIQIDLC